MKNFRKLLAILLALTLCLSNMVFIATAEGESTETTAAPNNVWSLHDKNANDEYIAFSENNTSPFSFIDVHLWYDGNFGIEANATGNNEHYDGRSFGAISKVVYEGESVQIGKEAFTANKAITYQTSEYSFIADVVDSDGTYGKVADGTIWGYHGASSTVAVVFTAPKTGNYTLTETITRWWVPNEDVNNEFTAPSRVVIETADGKVIKDLKGNTAESVTTTINLNAGEKVKLFVDNCGNGAGDNYTIDALTVKYNGAASVNVGDYWSFSQSGCLPYTNVNGKFAIGAIRRADPTEGADRSEFASIWAAYDQNAPFAYSDLKPMVVYDANKYIVAGVTANSDTNGRYRVCATPTVGYFSDVITSEVVKVFTFTAPADGVYTLSFDHKSYAGASVFSSVGANDLVNTGNIGNNGSFTQTVNLREGEQYNIGIGRCSGDYEADYNGEGDDLTPFNNIIGCEISNFKVTYTSAEFKYDFLDARRLGTSYIDGTSVFTVGSRAVSAEAPTGVGNALGKIATIIDGNSIHQETGLGYIDPSNNAAIKYAYMLGYYNNVLQGGIWFSGPTTTSAANWRPNGETAETVIQFKAPECGTYTFEFTNHELWGDASFKSRYYVEANGAILEGCDVQTPGNTTPFTMTPAEPIYLEKGECIYFVFNQGEDGHSNGQSGVIDKLTVTPVETKHDGTEWSTAPTTHTKVYSCCGDAVEATEAHTWGDDLVCDVCEYAICNDTFDFVENFTDLTNEYFTFGAMHVANPNTLMGTTTKWYTGSEDQLAASQNGSQIHPGSSGPLLGYGYYNNDGWGCCTGYLDGTNIVWATKTDFKNVIIFTAPIDGTYAYDLECEQYWDTKHSAVRYYVDVAGSVHNGNDVTYEKGTPQVDTKTNFKGTVDLKAGETIYFVYDYVEDGAGDNGLIKKLQVTFQHGGGIATCKDKAVCANCGESYGELDSSNHEDANGTWTKTEEGHSFNRTCCDETDIALTPHDGDPCSVCEYEVPAVIPPYTAAISSDLAVSTKVGQKIYVKVVVGGSSVNFSAGQFTLAYDEAKLAFDKDASTLNGGEAGIKNGVVTVVDHGEVQEIGTEYVLVFTATADGTAAIELTTAGFSTYDVADSSDLTPAVIDDSAKTVSVTIAKANHTITLPESGILVSDVTEVADGAPFTFRVENVNYKYTITATMGETTLTVGSGITDNGDGTYTIAAVTDEVTVTATREAKTFTVTIPEKHKGDNVANATYGQDYTLTILPNVPADTEPGVIYTATVTIGGVAATFKSINDNVYVIAGTDITGVIEITVTEREVPVNTYTVTVEGDTDGAVVENAVVNQGQTATLTITLIPGYTYSVTATMGANDATVSVNGNVYTVSDVRGDVVFTVTMSVPVNNLKVSDKAYLGDNVWLILNDVDKLASGVYTYDGADMFWSDKYEAYCFLVFGAKPTELGTLDVNKNGTATVVSYEGDVNKTGVIDANDAQLVYNMYNEGSIYSDFTVVSMEKFLRADINGDGEVNTLDAAAVISIAINN